MQQVIEPKIVTHFSESEQIMYSVAAVSNTDGFVWWLTTFDEGAPVWSRVRPRSTKLYDIDELVEIFEDPDVIIGSADVDPDLRTMRIVEIAETHKVTMEDVTKFYWAVQQGVRHAVR